MTLEELEKRVKAIEDTEEIKQLHIKYILALNEQNFEEMIECFAEDAIEEGILTGQKHEGKEEIAKMLREMARSQREVKMWKGGQILIHPIISVEGDRATGCWTWYRIGIPRKYTSEMGKEIMMLEPYEARYDMEYRRVDGKWKMSRLKFTSPWPAEQWPK